METLARFFDRREPVRPNDLCSVLVTRFAAEPEATALAVVEQGNPVGLVARDVFAALQSGSPDTASRVAVASVMERNPPIFEASGQVGGFIDDLLLRRPQALAPRGHRRR